jgi:hypothetical protein
MILFKDIAHLYIGCKLQVESPIKDTFVGELTPTHYATFVSHNGTIMGAKVTPILLPLSAMTEEQAFEFCKSKMSGAITHIDTISNYGVFYEYRYGSGRRFKQWQTYSECNSKQIAWLLKNHFDVYNLIENGQAIDATTLEVNPYK